MPATWNRVLVTGASSGIGEAFARQLAADGSDLVLVARRGEVLEELAAELSEHDVEVEVLTADLTDEAELGKVIQRVADEARPVELLINNAGFGTAGRFHEADADEQDRMIRLNISAVVALTHTAIPVMTARGRGGILNVASMGALTPVPMMAVYGATKSFVLSFSEALHEELRGKGIHVTCLNPGLTSTEFQEVADLEQAEHRLPGLLWQTPEPVAKAGLDAVARNRAVVAPGINGIGQALSRLVPSAVLRKGTGIAMRSL